MNNIRVDIRLRPIRFGFLVRPTDDAKILEILRLNTCLWGGMFNPIIPYFESVPSWLEEEGFRFESAEHIINDYLDFFEPDFLVEAEEGLADGFGFDSERVLQLKNIIEEPGGNYVHQYGLSVYGLYKELYEKEYQFHQRHRFNVVHVKPAVATFTNFVASIFGSFPMEEKRQYFEQHYMSVFNPAHVTLDGAELSKLYESEFLSALRIGCEKLRMQYKPPPYDKPPLPTLFILDAEKSGDVVDFWNLRAIHQHVRAVPIQWIHNLAPFCEEFIRNNLRRDPDHDLGTVVSPVLMFAGSLSEGDIGEIAGNFPFANGKDSFAIRRWAPIISHKLSVFDITSPTRPTLQVEWKSMNTPIDSESPEIRFDPLFPEFADEHYNRFRVANVVKLQDWSNENYAVKVRDRNDNDQIATVFPRNYKNPTIPKFQPESQREWDFLLPTSEGFVIFPFRRELFERWGLVDGTTAFNQWFNANQVPATPSDGGRATEQIIRTLGGLKWGVLCLAYKGVIELLEEMTRSVTKTAHYLEFKNKIRNAIDYKDLKDRIAETLVDKGVVELGLKLKCTKCSSWTWYSLKQLDYSLTCDLCRKQFDFPVTNPVFGKHSKWAYRVVGPFALPDYANGGYAASLSIRFFADVVGAFDEAQVTWSSAQKLELKKGNTLEADFILWYRSRDTFGAERSLFRVSRPIFGSGLPTETVFGEAKSFGEDAFEQKDIDRMKSLAEKFPGSVLVFATMKEELSEEEIGRIRKLANWGRGYSKERRQTRAPVIVLTGTELFSPSSLRHTWENKGGRHKDLAGGVWQGLNNLRFLADATQYLYLGMPPFGLAMIGITNSIRRN